MIDKELFEMFISAMEEGEKVYRNTPKIPFKFPTGADNLINSGEFIIGEREKSYSIMKEGVKNWAYIIVRGNTYVNNFFRKLGFSYCREHEGIKIPLNKCSNYYAINAMAETIASKLTENGIKSVAVYMLKGK